MAYIRKKTEELTGYQNGLPWNSHVDLECDFVMVYRLNESTRERICKYREKGYVVHLMTGISWGSYQDYLDGKWDGRAHWEEGQLERSGKPVLHGPTVPYMVPTVSFSDYLTQKLKVAVDAGVEAIHVEEPEFWDRSGYSEAFRREYEIYYKEPWKPQHQDLDACYKAAKLKAYLFYRTIDRVSSALKEYAKVTYNRNLRFYVPTHSLINYTQWKIISPESALTDIPALDGYIAQVWTGTSREANVYEGIYKERTFETSYLEYSVMQELVKGTGRRMWFLHDPIEDIPSFTWENYRYNYIKTAVASLLHPRIWHYEICPWPERVFKGKYPKFQPRITERDETSYETEDSRPIPGSYATLLSGMFQMFGDMEQEDICFEGISDGIGVFMSDTAMFQRSFPDGIVQDKTLGTRLMQAKHTDYGKMVDEAASAELMKEIGQEPSLMHDFVQSVAFPSFFGLSMPLLKYGLPVRIVQLDNVRNFAGYLDDCRFLVLSYEYMKPKAPDINAALVFWMRDGGTLFYVGDGSDPYHEITSWWKNAGYANPAQHLFEMTGLGRTPENGSYTVGKGRIVVWNMFPARICLDERLPEQYRSLVKEALAEQALNWEYRNDLTLHRGPYVISAVMDESVTDQSKVFEGLYADMLENDYRIIHRKEILPDENAILFDFSKIEDEKFRVIGTSARVLSVDIKENSAEFRLKTAEDIRAYTRMRMPKKVIAAEAMVMAEEAETAATEKPLTWEWDDETHTLLLSYSSMAEEVQVTVQMEE